MGRHWITAQRLARGDLLHIEEITAFRHHLGITRRYRYADASKTEPLIIFEVDPAGDPEIRVVSISTDDSLEWMTIPLAERMDGIATPWV